MASSTRVSPHYLGVGVVLYGEVQIGPGCVVEDYCVIGKPDMYALAKARNKPPHQPATDGITRLGAGVILGAGTKVYTGCVLADEVETEDDVRIGWNAEVGARTRLMYRAQVYCGVKIGMDCRVAGFLGDNVDLADRVAFFGNAVHDYPHRTTTYEWRPSPSVLSDAIVGTGAVLIGGVTIGERAYVAANAVVTRDVPADYVCFGANRLMPRSRWHGRLGQLD